MDELVKHRRLPRVQVPTGFKRRFQGMRPEGPERDSEKSEQSGGQSDPTGDGIHGGAVCGQLPRKQTHQCLQLMYRLLPVCLLLALSVTLIAQDDLVTTADIGYASRRIFRGVERS